MDVEFNSLARAALLLVFALALTPAAAQAPRAQAEKELARKALSTWAAAQGSAPSDPPPDTVPRTMAPTMMQIVPYPDEMYGVEVPYASCYRIRRCSAYDLFRFSDRPNWLTRLAPEAPTDAGAADGPVSYAWFFVPVTPEENILPKYRSASQVRDEHRAVGRPIDGSN